ncbi:MAG: DUF2079 domain-containing protein [Fibrobacterota bacterium]
MPEQLSHRRIAALLALTGFAVFFTLSFKRYLAFNADLDLGNITQAFWNTLHGRFMQMTWPGTDALGCRWIGHTELFFVLLVPFFALFPHPVTLLVLQSAALAGAGFALFLLARERLKNGPQALLVSTAYFVFPFLPSVALSDFHADPFMLPPLFLALYYYRKGAPRRFWVFMLLTLSCKEYTVLPVFLIGTLIALHDRRNGILLMLTALFWYVLIVPTLARILGSSVFAIQTESHALFIPASAKAHEMTAVIQKAAAALLRSGNIMSLAQIGLLFGLTLRYYPQGFILILPALGGLLFLNQAGLFTTHRHALLIPLLFITLVEGLARMPVRFRTSYAIFGVTLPSLLMLLLLPTSVIGRNLREMFLHPEYRNPFHYRYTPHDRLCDSLLVQIPADAPLSTDNNLRTKLACREWVFMHPAPRDLSRADWYAFDFFETLDYVPNTLRRNRFAALMRDGRFALASHVDGIVLFRKMDVPEPVRPFSLAMTEAKPDSVPAETALQPLSCRIRPDRHGFVMETEFRRGKGAIQGDALISFFTGNGGDTLRVLHLPSYTACRLDTLEPGVYRECFYFEIPAGATLTGRSHRMALYRKDAYLPFFARPEYCLTKWTL